ncbi:hypothetical protein Q8F55_002256 [Vanrija albida]|uniref:Tyrosine-protein phosphatase domain-containing protein n=1 Tax=Vanrija albida TaxID=181172 RepID=A0ABR3Q9H8_9TREE
MTHVAALQPNHVPGLVVPQPPWPPAQPPSNMLLKEWKYEMRREAQEILPGLYLGPFQASTNMAKLRSMGITHIICLRDSVEARLIFPRFPTEFKYLTMDVADSGTQNIISIFPQCRAFLDEAMNIGGAVLVHDNSGIATAPSIVIGYLMYLFGWEFETALQFVQSKRYCVSTASFENQLREYAPIAAAQRGYQQLQQQQQQNGGSNSLRPNAVPPRKRSWDGEGDTPGGQRLRFGADDEADVDMQ